MKKINYLFIILFLGIIVTAIPTVVNATAIIKGTNNYVQFPHEIKKGYIQNWDGYYEWSCPLTKLTSDENVTFKVQSCCISDSDVQVIQDKSDATSDDDEFRSFLNSYVSSYINESKWSDLTNFNYYVECTLSSDHTDINHLVFIKVNANGNELIVWQGYGNGFNRINQLRTAPVLDSIEVVTQPTKTEYKEGESFNTSGMTVVAHYTNETSEAIADYTYEPEGALTKDNTVITISYTKDGITKSTTLQIKVSEPEVVHSQNTTPEPKADTTKPKSEPVKQNEDTSKAPGNLPYTGGEFIIIVSLLVTAGLGVFLYKKNKDLKGI